MRSALLCLCSILALTGCKETTEPQAEIIRPIRSIQIGLTESFSERKFPGKAQASDAVTLAFEVPGKLNKIPVDVGDVVKKGQALMSLDESDFKNALDAAEAEMNRAQAQFQRMEKAAAANAVSRQELSDAVAAYDAAKANVEIKKKALMDTILLAPYDSIVAAKYVSSFGNIQAKQNAVRLVDPTKIEMVVNIPEDLISLAAKGMKISVEYDAFPELIISATISEVGAEASETTRTYPITLLMEQPEGKTILPGMSGKAWRSDNVGTSPDNNKRSGYEVPISALVSDVEGHSFVWVINPETGIVQRHKVSTGEITKNGILIKGLTGGEIIATAGVNTLQEGQKVRIVE